MANYTLSFAEGTGSDATTAGTIAWQSGNYPNTLSPTDFDRRHTANISVDYRLGEGEGPMIGGVRLLENFGVNLLGQFLSGLPYTPVTETASVLSDTPLGISTDVNQARLPATTSLDLRIDRTFDLGFSSLKAYLWVQNVLDTRNVLTIYRYTGTTSSSGYLQTPAGQQDIVNNEAVMPGAFLFNYQAFEQGPVYVGRSSAVSGGAGNVFYAPPRQIRLGLLVNF